MNYFFPGPIAKTNFVKVNINKELLYYNSGETCIYLLLKSFNLKKEELVMVPAFVCDSVKNAIYNAGLKPYYIDLISDSSFWSDYNIKLIAKNNIKVILLTHLFGEIHPQNKNIIKFSKNNKVYLIHDACQSYGINEKILKNGSIIYSFGAGKSTTAAGGGAIKLNGENIINNSPNNPLFLSKIRTKIFFKKRVFNSKITFTDRLLWQILIRIKPRNISTMTKFQIQCANYIMSKINNIELPRKQKFNLLDDYLQSSSKIIVLNDLKYGIFYKMVLFVKDGDKFSEYLHKNSIPFYRMSIDLKVDCNQFGKLKNFIKSSNNIFQISTEHVLPDQEIKRIGELLSAY